MQPMYQKHSEEHLWDGTGFPLWQCEAGFTILILVWFMIMSFLFFCPVFAIELVLIFCCSVVALSQNVVLE